MALGWDTLVVTIFHSFILNWWDFGLKLRTARPIRQLDLLPYRRNWGRRLFAHLNVKLTGRGTGKLKNKTAI